MFSQTKVKSPTSEDPESSQARRVIKPRQESLQSFNDFVPAEGTRAAYFLHLIELKLLSLVSFGVDLRSVVLQMSYKCKSPLETT